MGCLIVFAVFQLVNLLLRQAGHFGYQGSVQVFLEQVQGHFFMAFLTAFHLSSTFRQTKV